MKEYTITKTLFKMKKKKNTYYRQSQEKVRTMRWKVWDSFLWGWICEMDLMTFASILGH